jgi:hypothetical protein
VSFFLNRVLGRLSEFRCEWVGRDYADFSGLRGRFKRLLFAVFRLLLGFWCEIDSHFFEVIFLFNHGVKMS